MRQNNGSLMARITQLETKVAAQATIIAYLEGKLAAIGRAPVARNPMPQPRKLPTSARSIPDAAQQILMSEPRRMPLLELVTRMRAIGLDVKAASVSRSLSRDQRFTSYADGWGFTVTPGTVMVGTSTNGNHLELTTMWESSDPLRRPLVTGFEHRPLEPTDEDLTRLWSGDQADEAEAGQE